MEKNYIFFSNYCHHSKKLLNLLKENNILNNYQLCCVDDSQIELPSFINCVPTLYIVNQKRTLNDDSLFHFINIEINKSRNTQQQQMPQQQMPQQQMPQQQMPQQQMPQQQMPQQQMPQQQIPQQNVQSSDDVNPFHSNEMGANFSDNYSFINENENNITHNYSFLDSNSQNISNTQNQNQNQNQNQMTQNNQYSNGRSQKSQIMDKAYEELMKQRGQDSQQHISTMRF